MQVENIFLELILILNGKMMLYLMEVKKIVFSKCFHNFEFTKQKMINSQDHNIYI